MKGRLLHILFIIFLILFQESFSQIFSFAGLVPNLAVCYIISLIYFQKMPAKNEYLFLTYCICAILIDWITSTHVPFKSIYLIAIYLIAYWIYSSVNKTFISYLITSFLALWGYFVYNNLVISFFEKISTPNPMLGGIFALLCLPFILIFYYVFSFIQKDF
jgi:hypothetical protein